MAGESTRKVSLSTDEAKQRLIDEAPRPLQAFVHDPAALVRRYPREAAGIVVAAGILLVAMPRVRRRLFAASVEAARLFLT